MRPTQIQINDELKALAACKSYVPEVSKLGDNNWKSIDAQIEFLKGELDTTAEEFNEMDSNERDAVIDAEGWKEGMISDPPHKAWHIYRDKPTKK